MRFSCRLSIRGFWGKSNSNFKNSKLKFCVFFAFFVNFWETNFQPPSTFPQNELLLRTYLITEAKPQILSCRSYIHTWRSSLAFGYLPHWAFIHMFRQFSTRFKTDLVICVKLSGNFVLTKWKKAHWIMIADAKFGIRVFRVAIVCLSSTLNKMVSRSKKDPNETFATNTLVPTIRFDGENDSIFVSQRRKSV